ncbi:hypothetical protein ABIB90_008488 [Bradyrhizobium sp. JR4.1]|uniref:hypothetical protein n=1 Tax=unclassified Bradyrhizobium TaxID=2631580 RepID=UPI00339A67D7
MISADQSNENTDVSRQLPIAGNWHLPEWIWGVSFFLSIMLAMAGWLYVVGTLSIKVVWASFLAATRHAPPFAVKNTIKI